MTAHVLDKHAEADAPQPVSRSRAPRRRNRMARVDSFYGYAFVAPVVVGFAVFVLVPVIGVVAFSVQDYNSFSGRSIFVGVENYTQLANDGVFARVLQNTAVFSLATIPAVLLLGLGLAVAVNSRIPGIAIFRTAYFVPVVVSMVAWSLVWNVLLQDSGGINGWLAMVGIDGPNWLADEAWAMPSLIALGVIKGVGVPMVLFLAALQNVPEELKEAARIDGATGWGVFRHVVLPLIAPTTIMVAILVTIGTLKAFAQIFVLTHGGPGISTAVLGFYIYQQAFEAFQVGYASAASIILLVLVLALTLLQWWTRKKWVFNES
jgi:multiple sugar transport system permease protein